VVDRGKFVGRTPEHGVGKVRHKVRMEPVMSGA